MARVATTLPWHTSRTRSFTRSHDLSLLSIARLNKASSRVRFWICKRTNRPYILQLQRRLLSDEFPFIPGYMPRRGVNVLVHDGSSHSVNDEPSLNRAANGGLRP
jgi:hypothetical protein